MWIGGSPRKPHGNFMETLCLSCVLPGCYQTSSYDILWTVALRRSECVRTELVAEVSAVPNG